MKGQYRNMTFSELEREAYRTQNELANALLDKMEAEFKKEFSALFKQPLGDSE